MLNEYFIKGKAILRNNKSEFYNISEASWGIDEFDALNKLIKKSEKNLLHVENPSNTLLFSICRVRATGRSKSRLKESPKPFFDNNENSNSKGIISSYYMRFMFSETEEELIHSGEEFKMKMNSHTFSQESIQNMRNYYKNQQNRIRLGEVNPESFDLEEGKPITVNQNKIFNHYLNKSIKYFKMLGNRVIKKGNLYKITYPSCNSHIPIETSRTLTKVGLILAWEHHVFSLSSAIHILTNKWGIKGLLSITEKKSVLTLIQDSCSDDMLSIYINNLKKNNISAFVNIDDINIKSIYVLNSEELKTNQIISFAHSKVHDKSYCNDDPCLGIAFWNSIDNMLEP